VDPVYDTVWNIVIVCLHCHELVRAAEHGWDRPFADQGAAVCTSTEAVATVYFPGCALESGVDQRELTPPDS
jgi:hypothetical protein